MKYRKRPVIVEAEQWFPCKCVVGVFSETWGLSPELHYYVVTAHGQKAFLEKGDWVIAEPDGRGHYPCKPDIFDATYVPVIDDKPSGKDGGG